MHARAKKKKKSTTFGQIMFSCLFDHSTSRQVFSVLPMSGCEKSTQSVAAHFESNNDSFVPLDHNIWRQLLYHRNGICAKATQRGM